MIFLLGHIRKIIYFVSIFGAILLYIFWYAVAQGNLPLIRITESYALTALFLLYFTLLISPLYFAFPSLPFQTLVVRARRGLGVSAFFFGFLHANFAFFGLLGGFSGLGFLSNSYLIAISLSFTALLILTSLAATSFDFMVARLGSRWKMLHRLVYIAGVLIVIHALMLGTHFQDLYKPLPEIFFIMLGILLVLEAFRLDHYIANRFATFPRLGFASGAIVSVLVIYLFLNLFPGKGAASLNVHSQHQQLANQGSSQTKYQMASVPGMNMTGDRSKRYHVNFQKPDTINPNQDAELRFQVYDAANGNPVTLYNLVYEKIMHLIIVNDGLTYYNHIHPERSDTNEFVITTRFPTSGSYRLYVDFQPIGATEQQFAFVVQVGNAPAQTVKAHFDSSKTKTFGKYEVTLKGGENLRAAEMSQGRQKLSFAVKDAKTKQPFKKLRPYLGAFGHLVMINEQTYDYIHVHPTNRALLAANAVGGPDVDFLPFGIYGPFKPGEYRVFLQLSPNGELFTADFAVTVR